jgi:pyrimidine oxygenase
MAGLAAITSRIKLYATVPTLVIPPAIAARMTSTIDSISNGRFGLNVITGWQRPEYAQMGLWPGDEYFARRYDFAPSTCRSCRSCGTTGVSNFKGEFFKMDDCRLEPRPQAPIKVISAGRATPA